MENQIEVGDYTSSILVILLFEDVEDASGPLCGNLDFFVEPKKDLLMG